MTLRNTAFALLGLALLAVAAFGLGQAASVLFSRGQGTASVDARALVTNTLSEIYAAYGLDDEGATYDQIAAVATGAALEVLYLQRREALANTGLEDSVQTVHEIELNELVSRVDDGALTTDARWFVLGLVGHGEHTHLRGNGYRASLTFVPEVDDKPGWTLTEFDLKAVERDS